MRGSRSAPADQVDKMVVLLEGVVDALGVIVGPQCHHLPGEAQVLPARRGGGGPSSRSLCGKPSGSVHVRVLVVDQPACRNWLRIAEQLVRVRGRVRSTRWDPTAPEGETETTARR